MNKYKSMTTEQRRAYDHAQYLAHREEKKAKQRAYYQAHKREILMKCSEKGWARYFAKQKCKNK